MGGTVGRAKWHRRLMKLESYQVSNHSMLVSSLSLLTIAINSFIRNRKDSAIRVHANLHVAHNSLNLNIDAVNNLAAAPGPLHVSCHFIGGLLGDESADL